MRRTGQRRSPRLSRHRGTSGSRRHWCRARLSCMGDGVAREIDDGDSDGPGLRLGQHVGQPVAGRVLVPRAHPDVDVLVIARRLSRSRGRPGWRGSPRTTRRSGWSEGRRRRGQPSPSRHGRCGREPSEDDQQRQPGRQTHAAILRRGRRPLRRPSSRWPTRTRDPPRKHLSTERRTGPRTHGRPTAGRWGAARRPVRSRLRDGPRRVSPRPTPSGSG